MLNEIVFIESQNTKLNFYLTDTTIFTITATLTAYAQLLKYSGFCKVQQSYVVNLMHVKKIKKAEKIIFTKQFPTKEIHS